MDRYDWPLLAVTLLIALSITLALRALWTILGLLRGMRLTLSVWRQTRQ
jgi:hypothetical protein